VEQRQSVGYDLYDKTSITWDDDRKVAAFITSADSALRNYTSFIRQTCKEEVIQTYSAEMQTAIQVYNALVEIGCLYQVDPTSPFTELQEKTQVVDSVSLPRNTLKRITGDCDDLTVLYDSLLETVGIETAFITAPGHIYACFNTKIPGRQYRLVHPDRQMTINVEDELWVPVEITMIGRGSFMEAWHKGVEEWAMYQNDPVKRGFYITRASQELYRPVGLKETDLGLQYGDKDNIIRGFQNDMGELVEVIVSEYRDTAQKSGKTSDWNRLGIAYAKFSRYDRAEDAFNRALNINPGYINAQINLGNIAYLRQSYQQALSRFQRAFDSLQQRGKGQTTIALKVLLNLSKTNYELKRYDESKEFYAKAHSINPEKTEQYAYLGGGTGKARASAAVDTRMDILFAEEEE